MVRRCTGALAALCLAAILSAAAPTRSEAQPSGEDSQSLLTIDHYVAHRSTVPSIAGQTAELYVRERVKPATVLRGEPAAGRVVLFVHGAGTPAEVAFDVPYADYSWMAYLASAGFDVFSVDMTGYGRSTRPGAMNDPCNLSAEQQSELGRAPCAPSHGQRLTTIASDWDDIDAVVGYVSALRHVERLSLIGWSLGGPRAGGYAAQHPDRVDKLVLLAPAYNPEASAEAPAANVAAGAAFNKQSHADFTANWERQTGCPDQFEQAASDSVWSAMLASDPVGATWGQGVRRAPNTSVWGWNRSAVARSETPTLIVAGVHDKQVPPARVRGLYEDLGARQKVFVDLGCSSHNAMWERNHLVLFRASLEWLTKGTVDGMQAGVLKLGY
jgi:pimeloyl-ACP methyl ester carboxylesterase